MRVVSSVFLCALYLMASCKSNINQPTSEKPAMEGSKKEATTPPPSIDPKELKGVIILEPEGLNLATDPDSLKTYAVYAAGALATIGVSVLAFRFMKGKGVKPETVKAPQLGDDLADLEAKIEALKGPLKALPSPSDPIQTPVPTQVTKTPQGVVDAVKEILPLQGQGVAAVSVPESAAAAVGDALEAQGLTVRTLTPPPETAAVPTSVPGTPPAPPRRSAGVGPSSPVTAAVPTPVPGTPPVPPTVLLVSKDAGAAVQGAGTPKIPSRREDADLPPTNRE